MHTNRQSTGVAALLSDARAHAQSQESWRRQASAPCSKLVHLTSAPTTTPRCTPRPIQRHPTRSTQRTILHLCRRPGPAPHALAAGIVPRLQQAALRPLMHTPQPVQFTQQLPWAPSHLPIRHGLVLTPFPAASAPGIAESLHTSSTAEPSPTAHPLLTLAASTSEELMASAPEWAAPDHAMDYTTPSHPSLDLLFPGVDTDPAAQEIHNPHLSLPVWPPASLYPSAYASPYAIHPTRASPPPAAALPASPVLLSMSFEESDSLDSALETPAISPSHGPPAPSPPSPPAVAAPCILAAPAHSVVLTTTNVVPSTLHAPPTPTDTHSTID